MKYSSELKIGLTGVITVIVIVWGINYLKGRNILRSNYVLSAVYSRVDGLEPSADVMLKGFKIGTVEDVIFESEKETPFTVYLEIDKKYPLPEGSIAEIFSADLLGSRAIQIVPSDQSEYLKNGDTIDSQISGDMISSVMDQIGPVAENINSLALTLDSVGTSLHSILSNPDIREMIEDLRGVSSSLNQQFASNGDGSKTLQNLKDITEAISLQSESIQKTVSNVEGISSDLESANLDSLLIEMRTIASNLVSITDKIGEGEGSAARLINDDSLYEQVNLLLLNLDSLVNDINENPKKYVGFSLFGK